MQFYFQWKHICWNQGLFYRGWVKDIILTKVMHRTNCALRSKPNHFHFKKGRGHGTSFLLFPRVSVSDDSLKFLK